VLDDQIGFILRQVSQRHTSIFADLIGFDVTPTQWAAMAKLHELGPTSQNELGRITAMDVATIKGVVDRLTRRGLCRSDPDPNDARRRSIALTPKGQALVEAHADDARAITEETLAPLSAAQRKVLRDLLAKLK
jgi:DNA-binding MarR family transcriptional regulator